MRNKWVLMIDLESKRSKSQRWIVRITNAASSSTLTYRVRRIGVRIDYRHLGVRIALADSDRTRGTPGVAPTRYAHG